MSSQKWRRGAGSGPSLPDLEELHRQLDVLEGMSDFSTRQSLPNVERLNPERGATTSGAEDFVRTMLARARANERTKVVDDQVGRPAMADDLAGTIARLAVDARPGIFHVTNQGAVSWFEFAREVFTLAGADPALVEPIPTAELHPPRPAPRPRFSVLDNMALRAAGIQLLPDFRVSLPRLVEALA